jgi:hypothetical protein
MRVIPKEIGGMVGGNVDPVGKRFAWLDMHKDVVACSLRGDFHALRSDGGSTNSLAASHALTPHSIRQTTARSAAGQATMKLTVEGHCS